MVNFDVQFGADELNFGWFWALLLQLSWLGLENWWNGFKSANIWADFGWSLESYHQNWVGNGQIEQFLVEFAKLCMKLDCECSKQPKIELKWSILARFWRDLTKIRLQIERIVGFGAQIVPNLEFCQI